ncbi:AMP-forming long-chain acyl-CoA synthetase [Clostridium bornimense]|uniref:AMP-forming long-chain acyl-CoA synthetase n=1 Tax=Clostridium bornimense TaxID=1216932 RepID=W6RU98_9CLOT|nr:AMP-binding protein [Clostridium bornimense]CDM68196.1 AMP-forming long-chain acyl-CoA synthetase [Clostridium bornimense]
MVQEINVNSSSINGVINYKEILIDSSNKYKDKVAFYEKKGRGKISHSYKELKNDVFRLGTMLLEIGLKDKHIAIIGENNYNWIISYLAVINGVGVAVPLDKELSEEQLCRLMEKSDVSVLIFSKTFLSSIEYIKEKVPDLQCCICIDENSYGYDDVKSLIDKGKEMLDKGNTLYLKSNVNIDSLNVIMFTSGTTGTNKGVMISQRNILSNVMDMAEIFQGYDNLLAVLPFHHAYENICGILTTIKLGITTFINDSLKYLSKNINEFKPEAMILVPLFLETMYRSVEVELKRKKLEGTFKKYLKVSNALLKINIDLRRKIFKKLIDNFGGNLKTIISGGALLREDLIKKFKDIGINVINGFGITECTPVVSINFSENLNSIGKPLSSVDISILNPDENGVGEILVHGDHVMLGYYKDDKSTKESFVNDWFKTGDLGYIDDSGYLYITGRKKNLIVLSNGKNVNPEELEEYILENMSYVKETLVYSANSRNGSKIIVGAVYIGKEYISMRGIENVRNQLEEDLRKINNKLPLFKQIQKIYIKEEEFEKNTSKKIVRSKFLEEGNKIGI